MNAKPSFGASFYMKVKVSSPSKSPVYFFYRACLWINFINNLFCYSLGHFVSKQRNFRNFFFWWKINNKKVKCYILVIKNIIIIVDANCDEWMYIWFGDKQKNVVKNQNLKEYRDFFNSSWVTDIQMCFSWFWTVTVDVKQQK